MGNEDFPRFTAWSSDAKKIAFTNSAFGEADVVKVFDFSSKRYGPWLKLPNTLLYEVSWLPQGNRLMVVYAEKGPNFARRQIGLVSSSDGKLQPVTRDANSYSGLTLSADGKNAATVQVKTTQTLHLIPGQDLSGKGAAGSGAQVDNVRVFDWTGDGKLIVSDGSRLDRVGSDGAREMALISDPSAAVQGLAGCTNAYVLVNWAFRGGQDGSTIWRVNADGSNPKKLTNGSYDSSPACSPDGKWVYYLDGLLTLMRVPVQGGQPEIVPGSKVPSAFQDAGAVDFSPDGRRLVLVADVVDPATQREQVKIAIVNLDSSPESVPQILDPDPRITVGITLGSLFTGGARFTRDGKAVVYDINDKGAGNLWMQPLDGSPGHQITNFTSEKITGFRWSPDGKSLAVMREHDTSDVVMLQETTQ
jgi:Tol biopolymer transport system component